VIQLARTFCFSYNWRLLHSCSEIRPGRSEIERKRLSWSLYSRIAYCMKKSQAGSNRERWEWETHGQDGKNQSMLCDWGLNKIAREWFLWHPSTGKTFILLHGSGWCLPTDRIPVTPSSKLHSAQSCEFFKQWQESVKLSRDTSLPSSDQRTNEDATHILVRVGLIPPARQCLRVPTLPCQGWRQTLWEHESTPPVPHVDLRTGWITFWGCLLLKETFRWLSAGLVLCNVSDSTPILTASSMQFTAKTMISVGLCTENVTAGKAFMCILGFCFWCTLY